MSSLSNQQATAPFSEYSELCKTPTVLPPSQAPQAWGWQQGETGGPPRATRLTDEDKLCFIGGSAGADSELKVPGRLGSAGDSPESPYSSSTSPASPGKQPAPLGCASNNGASLVSLGSSSRPVNTSPASTATGWTPSFSGLADVGAKNLPTRATPSYCVLGVVNDNYLEGRSDALGASSEDSDEDTGPCLRGAPEGQGKAVRGDQPSAPTGLQSRDMFPSGLGERPSPRDGPSCIPASAMSRSLTVTNEQPPTPPPKDSLGQGVGSGRPCPAPFQMPQEDFAGFAGQGVVSVLRAMPPGVDRGFPLPIPFGGQTINSTRATGAMEVKTEKADKLEKVEKMDSFPEVEKLDVFGKTNKLEQMEKTDKPEKMNSSPIIEKFDMFGKADKLEKVEKVHEPEKVKVHEPEKVEKVHEPEKEKVHEFEKVEKAYEPEKEKVHEFEKTEKVEKAYEPEKEKVHEFEKVEKAHEPQKEEKRDKMEKANKMETAEKVDKDKEKMAEKVDHQEKANKANEKPDKKVNGVKAKVTGKSPTAPGKELPSPDKKTKTERRPLVPKASSAQPAAPKNGSSTTAASKPAGAPRVPLSTRTSSSAPSLRRPAPAKTENKVGEMKKPSTLKTAPADGSRPRTSPGTGVGSTARTRPTKPPTPTSAVPERKPPVPRAPRSSARPNTGPTPDLRNARSKIGSTDNMKHQPGGGKVSSSRTDSLAQGSLSKETSQGKIHILYKKVDLSKVTSKCGSKDNIKHKPGGGDVKIQSHKANTKAQSKLGSMDNMNHEPGHDLVKDAGQGNGAPPSGEPASLPESVAKENGLNEATICPGDSFRNPQGLDTRIPETN